MNESDLVAGILVAETRRALDNLSLQVEALAGWAEAKQKRIAELEAALKALGSGGYVVCDGSMHRK